MAWKASLASKTHWTPMWRLGDLPKFFNWQQQKRDMNRKNKNITNSKPFANFKLSELIMRIGKKTLFFGTCVYLDHSNISNNLTFRRQSWVCPWKSCWVTWFASAAMRREHLPETRILGVSSKEDWYAQYLSKIRCSVSQGSCILLVFCQRILPSISAD